MQTRLSLWPILLCAVAILAMLAYGPIAQLPRYHDFADQSVWHGIPHAQDVLSNLPFALLAVWGGLRLWPRRAHDGLRPARWAYALFFLGLLATAVGSAYYHWAPDNARLLWDRLPLALTTAGLLAAVRADTRPGADAVRDLVLLALFAVAGVLWWAFTARRGTGDLRPYLLLQGMALVLIPLWQAAYKADLGDRLSFGAAMLVYCGAKAAELHDHEILAALGTVSGHTLKHLLAALAAALIIARLDYRTCKRTVRPSRRINNFKEICR